MTRTPRRPVPLAPCAVVLALTLASCGDPAGPPHQGSITVLQHFDGAHAIPPASWEVDAEFQTQWPGNCQHRFEGPCEITVCTLPTRGTLGGTVAPTAGPIHVSGGSNDPLDLWPGVVTGVYPAASGATRRWVAGDAITVRAAGGDVPAFTAAVTQPEDLAVIAPVPTTDGAGDIRVYHAEGLDVRWSGNDPGTVLVVVTIASPGPDTFGQRLECTFDRAAGAAHVSPEALGALWPSPSPSDSALIGTLRIDPVDRRVVHAGDYEVTVESRGVGGGGMVELQ